MSLIKRKDLKNDNNKKKPEGSEHSGRAVTPSNSILNPSNFSFKTNEDHNKVGNNNQEDNTKSKKI
jgi:hypothetical protein